VLFGLLSPVVLLLHVDVTAVKFSILTSGSMKCTPSPHYSGEVLFSEQTISQVSYATLVCSCQLMHVTVACPDGHLSPCCILVLLHAADVVASIALCSSRFTVRLVQLSRQSH